MPVCCGLKSNHCQVPSSEPLSLTQGLCPIRSVCRWLAELQLFGITAATWAKGNAWNKLAPERRMTCGKVMPTHSLCVSLNQSDPWLKFLDRELKQSTKTQEAHAVICSPLQGGHVLTNFWTSEELSPRDRQLIPQAHTLILCRHFCNSHRGNKRFCAGGGWNCVCVCYYFLIVLRHANAWKATGKISSLRQTKANIGALRWEG